MTDPTVVWRNNEDKQAFILAGNYDTPDIVCHVDSSPASDAIELKAGDSMNFQWTEWPLSHRGPIMSYLANAGDDFSKVDKVNLQFVKIEELGLIHNTTDKADLQGYYAADKLRDSGNRWTITIPNYVAPGNYVVRNEIIALMGAKVLGQAQHYPQCINIKVTGNGKDPIASGVRAKDFYKATDPGIQVDIYQNFNYQIPGPKLYQPNGAVPVVGSTAPAAIPSAQVTSASPVIVASTVASAAIASITPVSLPSGVPLPASNATAFPSFHYLPSKSRAAAAASTPSSEPSKTSNTDKGGDYTYEFPGLGDGKTGTEESAPKKAGTGPTKGATESTGTGPTKGTTESTGTKGVTKSAGTGTTGGAKTYDYSPAVDTNEKPPTSTPGNEKASSFFSAKDLTLPKGATVEQLIAFLEKLLQALKAKALNGRRTRARDFSMK